MKHLFLLAGLILVACTENPPTSASPAEQPEEPKPELSVQLENIENSGPSPFFDSLTEGFDVRDFLAEMGFSNSGGGGEIYYFRPKEEGMYYSYFGSSHFSGDIYGKVTLTTYIYGEKVGIYNQQDQAFIELSVRVKDPALGKLDLIGKPAALFRNHPAMVYQSKKGIILQENEQTLKLVFCNDSVCAFDYARIKNPFAKLTPDERNALRN